MKKDLLDDLLDARRRTLTLVEDLSDDQLDVEYTGIVNPYLWELGHIAYFYDAFIHDFLHEKPTVGEGGARLYDSFEVEHTSRWFLDLPDRAATMDYLRRVEASVVDLFGSAQTESDRGYCYRLCNLHEDMHTEAFQYTRQTLGYSAPALPKPQSVGSGPHPGDAAFDGGTFLLGSAPETRGSDPETSGSDPKTSHFLFDNEKWQHPVEVAGFRIAKAPVTNLQFLEFVEDGGYEREELWSFRGWIWRCDAQATAPNYWVRRDDKWAKREYDVEVPLPPHQPMVYVNAFEAAAYAAWAGRRLPTEAEWELAASFDPETGTKRRYPWGEDPANASRANLDGVLGCVDVAACADGDSPLGCRQMIGNIWEWIGEEFYPFPGFTVDQPYREYSSLAFGTRQVLRGGSFATRARLAHNNYRNFFEPERRDVPAGFRTCALDR